MNEPIKLEDFQKVMPLTAAYELKPGVTYLVVADGKNFNYDLVNSLLNRVREDHPDINIHIIATKAPKDLEVREQV